jgi:RND family efflux transporter MFP subunit
VTAINIDDDLTIEENAWRGRIVSLLVLLIIGAAVAIAAYIFYFNDDAETVARSTEDITVAKGTINQTLIISGVADAQFNSDLVFQGAGKVSAVNVKVGDTVQQGDVLASLESDDLANAVASASANQQAAQLKLDDLLAGSTAAELAAADQALASAQAGLTKAQNDYDDLLDGVSDADLAAARQGVSAAQAQLATAEANRAKLDDSPSAADIAAAEAGVTSAQSGLTSAQNLATNAQNSVTSAGASLKSAESAYCSAAGDTSPSFCTTQSAPISSGDATAMTNALSGSKSSLASAVIGANTGYLNAVNGLNSANAAVTSAQQSLDSAEARRDAVNDGPSDSDIAASDAAVDAALAGLASAEDKLATAENGATDFQRSTAAAALDSAYSALAAAQAKRDEAYRGEEQNTIDQARAAVRSASLQVEAAEIRLKNAQIIAPFDGTVGAVNAKAGEFFSAVSADGPAIVLLTPDALTLKMNIGETDYANIKSGQAGGVLFDSIPGRVYPFVITEIGLSPAVTQGVVTYDVKASIVIPAGAPRPAPGMNARGQIITDSKPNLILIPPRAIRKKGDEQVVDVRRGGEIVEQVVVTGVSDNNNIEIVSGLNEGDVVVVAALTSVNSQPTPKPQPTLPGGVR